MYFNAEIYNVEQRWINVVYFNVDINNVRQRQNKVAILMISFKKKDCVENSKTVRRK